MKILSVIQARLILDIFNHFKINPDDINVTMKVNDILKLSSIINKVGVNKVLSNLYLKTNPKVISSEISDELTKLISSMRYSDFEIDENQNIVLKNINHELTLLQLNRIMLEFKEFSKKYFLIPIGSNKAILVYKDVKKSFLNIER